jgi:hypothetical protein
MASEPLQRCEACHIACFGHGREPVTALQSGHDVVVQRHGDYHWHGDFYSQGNRAIDAWTNAPDGSWACSLVVPVNGAPRPCHCPI